MSEIRVNKCVNIDPRPESYSDKENEWDKGK